MYIENDSFYLYRVRKLISIGFLYTAMWVLLVHSIVPHAHGNSVADQGLTEVSFEQESSLWSQIWEAIQFDPGEEHLEHFSIGQQGMLYAVLPEYNELVPTAFWIEHDRKVTIAAHAPAQDSHFPGDPLRRGPPVV